MSETIETPQRGYLDSVDSMPALDPRVDIQIDDKVHAIRRAISNLRNNGLTRVHVAIDDGAVLLTGTVSSFYLKQIAQEAVRPCLIGMRLVNELQVVAARRATCAH